jgi:hypothetical protein
LTRLARAARLQNVKPNFLLYRRKQEVAPPRCVRCQHNVKHLEMAAGRAQRRRVSEMKLKYKADAQSRKLLGSMSSDCWPTVATQGPQAGGAQPAMKRKAGPPPADLRQKLSRKG